MKILYLSDHYAKNVQGTKVSIFGEVEKRGFDIEFQDIHSKERNVIDGELLKRQVKEKGYTDIWIAHTWVNYSGCSLAELNDLGATVLGFGFSDPNNFDSGKLDNYNSYATNHYYTYTRLRDEGYPSFYFPTACDSLYHRDLGLEREYDVTVYGAGMHPFHEPKNYRSMILRKLMQDLPQYRFHLFGSGWDEDLDCAPPLGGEDFLRALNTGKLGLDLQQEPSPLAHRMFEFTACGTPAITFDRPEIRMMFDVGVNILTYSDYDNLKAKIVALLSDEEYRSRLKSQMYRFAHGHHNISNRVDGLIPWLQSLQS